MFFEIQKFSIFSMLPMNFSRSDLPRIVNICAQWLWAIARRDSMILTFHVLPLASGRELCGIDRV